MKDKKPWEKDVSEHIKKPWEKKSSEFGIQIDKDEYSFEREAAEAMADALKVIPKGALVGASDDLYAIAMTAYKQATGDERPIDELVKTYKQEAIDFERAAEDRSPIATFVSEAIASIPTQLLLEKGLGSTAKLQQLFPKDSIAQATLANMLYSATYDASDPEQPPEGMGEQILQKGKQMAMGGGLGALGQLGAKVVGKIFDEPVSMRAKTLGAVKTDFSKRFKDIRDIVKDTTKAKMFKGGGRSYDVTSGKFKPDRHGIKLEGNELEQYWARAEEAKGKIWEEISGIMDKESPDVVRHFHGDRNLLSIEEIMDQHIPDYLDIKHRFISEQADKDLARRLWRKVERNTFEGLQGDIGSSSLKDVAAMKAILHDEADAVYRNPSLLGASGKKEEAQVSARFARMLKEYIEKAVGKEGRRFKELNADYGKFAKLSGNIEDKWKTTTGQDSIPAAVRSVMSSPRYSAGVAAQGAVESPIGGMTRSGIGMWYEDLPMTGQEVIKKGPRLTPSILLERVLGPEATPQEVLPLPEGAANAPGRLDYRKPQSIGNPVYDDNFLEGADQLAENLMLSRMPRTTEGIMENKDVFLMKVAQQAPEQYDNVKYVFEKQPDQLSNILPALVHSMPMHFQNDKYERVDNIVPPPLRKMAEKDLWDRNDLSLQEKTEFNDRLNRTGEFEL